jgi:hypothetical protein
MITKYIVTTLVIYISSFSFLFSAYEVWPGGTVEKGLSGAVCSTPIEDAFLVNPANMPIYSKRTLHLMAAGSIVNTASKINEVGGTLFARVKPVKNLSVGGAFNYFSALYSGQQTSGAIWDEMLGNLSLAYRIGGVINLGIGGYFFRYGNSIQKDIGGDMSAGVHLILAKMVCLGLSGQNLITIENSTERYFNFGATVLLGRIIPVKLFASIDGSYYMENKNVDLRIAAGINSIAKKLDIRIGAKLGDTFKTISPSLGASLRLNKLTLHYGANFDLFLGGAGRHEIGISFDK